MLEANKDNSSLTIESSSIKFSNESRSCFYSLSFKIMEMVECKASLRSQCPHDWLKTHAKMSSEKQSTIVWKFYHVKGGGIRPVTLTTFYLL
jgi:hypothetical protein